MTGNLSCAPAAMATLAAEEANEALARIDALYGRVRRGEFTRSGLERDLLEISRQLHLAMRHLERTGAETEPE
ncbi:MAG: hypothetical protein H6661_10250 [Ardenticatenaceae bacterium]|nr:hypothetical protein [Ardenticatenaceae bacterium]